jgi:hypothetical protein
VTVKSEIREMLRKNWAVADIQRKTKSKSILYDCLTEYLAELISEVEATRTLRREENEKLQETQTENKLSLAQKNELENEVQTLQTDKEELSMEVGSLRKEHAAMHEDKKLLESKGFTPQIMTKLKAANDTNAEEDDALLQQREKRNELEVTVATLEGKKLTLGKAVNDLSSKVSRLEKKFASKENKIDILEAKENACQAVFDVLNAAIKEGYTPAQLKAMVLLLRKVEVESDPSLSISHLIECVAEARTLLNLRHEVDLTEKRLEELQKAENETSAKIGQAQNTILDGIEMAQAQGEDAISKLSTQAIAEADKIASQAIDTIRNVGNATREAIQCEAEALAKLCEEKGKIEQWVKPGRALFSLAQAPDGLEEISPELIIALLQNVAYWIDMKFTDFAVGAVYDGATDGFRFFDTIFPKFRVSALIKLARESIAREMARRSRKES